MFLNFTIENKIFRNFPAFHFIPYGATDRPSLTAFFLYYKIYTFNVFCISKIKIFLYSKISRRENLLVAPYVAVGEMRVFEMRG